METAVGKLTGIASKITSKGTIFEYEVEGLGINKPLAFFPPEDDPTFTPDYSMQGKMVNVGYVLVEKPWERDGRSGVYKNYYLRQIAAVEGNTGSLNDVLAPQVQQEATQTVVNRATNGVPASPSEAVVEYMRAKHPEEQKAIRKAVALNAAVELGDKLIPAGEKATPSGLLTIAEQFEAWLGRS